MFGASTYYIHGFGETEVITGTFDDAEYAAMQLAGKVGASVTLSVREQGDVHRIGMVGVGGFEPDIA